MEDTLVAHLQSMEHTDRHPVVSFISALFWVVCESSSTFSYLKMLTEQTVYLLSWVKALAALVTISVPHLIYSLLSYSMTLTVRPV
jgi:lysophospholipid hydrolase